MYVMTMFYILYLYCTLKDTFCLNRETSSFEEMYIKHQNALLRSMLKVILNIKSQKYSLKGEQHVDSFDRIVGWCVFLLYYRFFKVIKNQYVFIAYNHQTFPCFHISEETTYGVLSLKCIDFLFSESVCRSDDMLMSRLVSSTILIEANVVNK